MGNLSKQDELQAILNTLPETPGVYLFYNNSDEIIYIGKARNIKKRVASYFNRIAENAKLRVLVSKIYRIEHLIVDSETEALLLENNLIKKHQPRYNILLKDDKTYPWLCIKNEPFPRLITTRNKVNDGSSYFGPYASGKMLHTIKDLIQKLFPLRSCNYNLTPANIAAGKFKVCLEYHIGNCLGPCENKQSLTDYNHQINQVKEILKGHTAIVAQYLKTQMMEAAENLEFEKAQKFKEKLEILEKYKAKSTIVNPEIKNVEVLSVVSDDDAGYVNHFKVIDGAIVQGQTYEIKKKLDESDAEILLYALTELMNNTPDFAKEVILPFEVDIDESLGLKITIPKIGDKKKLLFLSYRNAKQYMIEKQRRLENVDPEKSSRRVLEKLQKDLRLKELPVHIECFDNSNIQGEYPVSAMVVFRNGKPSKKDYRHFNIRSVEGPDDYATMREVITRRYKRLIEENGHLPQLVIIDGGKGQLNAAVESLKELGLSGKMALIGIAKNLEEIYFPGDSIPLYIDKTSESLRLIQHLRDEAHRFGISHHRTRRSKATIKTELTELNGIGEATAQLLLKKFHSISRLLKADEKEIEETIGKSKTKIILEWRAQKIALQKNNQSEKAL